MTLFKKGLLTASTLAITLNLSHAKNCEHGVDSFSCVDFVRNYDGDSFTFNVPGLHPIFASNLKLRLAEAKTAPINSKTKCVRESGKKSKRFVKESLSKAKEIKLINLKSGRNSSVEGDVAYDGKILSKELLKKKMAVPKGTKNPDWCS